MEVFIEKNNETKKIILNKKVKLNKILDEMGISLESVILVKNGEVCLEDEEVSNDDKIKLLSVVSGG
ncbi:MAG: MoaD/ThiS family protein [Nanoarchaeota archaeon]|nr:MoaD/ThiS family protein [Nanoarchaeota archaeon]